MIIRGFSFRGGETRVRRSNTICNRRRLGNVGRGGCGSSGGSVRRGLWLFRGRDSRSRLGRGRGRGAGERGCRNRRRRRERRTAGSGRRGRRGRASWCERARPPAAAIGRRRIWRRRASAPSDLERDRKNNPLPLLSAVAGVLLRTTAEATPIRRGPKQDKSCDLPRLWTVFLACRRPWSGIGR